MIDPSPPAGEGIPSASPLRRAVHAYLEKTPERAGPRAVQTAIMAIIVLNVAAVVVETVPVEVGEGRTAHLLDLYPGTFAWLEWISVAIFSAEYLLRVWSITADPRYAHPFLGRLRFACTPMALVDLLSILPVFIQVGEARAGRALRLLRVFRIFKLGHYSTAMRSLHRALWLKRAELAVTVFVIGILLVLASTVMYQAEKDVQPDRFSSIPATMWWGIVTLTTVGYGDLTPVTPLGKLMGGVVAIFGIGLVALPAGILGSAFIQEIETSRRSPRCPHCGEEL